MTPGDVFMGLNLAAGGHLTHGSPVNMSGRWFKPIPYSVRRDDHRIDFDETAKLARQFRPKVIIAGGSAYPRILDFRRFREIADEIGAKLLVDMAHFAGLVAGGVHPNPFPHAHVVTSTAHKTLRGPRSGFILTNDEELAKKLNAAVFPGLQGGPLMHVVAAKAVAFGEALRPNFKLYARSVIANAKALAETLRSKGLDIETLGPERFRERLGICDDAACVKLEIRTQRLTEGHRLGGHHMHQRPSLQTGKDRRVEFFRQLLVIGEDEARTRPAQRLVRGRSDDMGVRERIRMHPAGDETGEMRHVDQKFGTDLVGDLAEAAEIEDARIGGPASDDDLRPKLTRKLR